MRLASPSGELTGEWSSPPPSYECIRGAQATSTMNLSEWMNMDLPGDQATGDGGDGEYESGDDGAGSGGGGADEAGAGEAGGGAGADGELGGSRGRVFDLAEFGRVFCGGAHR